MRCWFKRRLDVMGVGGSAASRRVVQCRGRRRLRESVRERRRQGVRRKVGVRGGLRQVGAVQGTGVIVLICLRGGTRALAFCCGSLHDQKDRRPCASGARA